MKIAVCVKQAAAVSDDLEFAADERDVDHDYLDWAPSEWDVFAIEEALRIRDGAGGEVVAVAVGNEVVEDALVQALAMGADRAIRVNASSGPPLDPMLTAAALALVLRDEAPELVLCGVLSSDSGHGATGSALAGLLDLPYAAAATRVQVDGGTAVVDRELEGGLVEVLEVTLPAVISVQTGINEPRYATLRSMQEARGADLSVVQNGAAAQPASHIQRMFVPARGGATMLEGGPSELAQSILEIVRREVE